MTGLKILTYVKKIYCFTYVRADLKVDPVFLRIEYHQMQELIINHEKSEN